MVSRPLPPIVRSLRIVAVAAEDQIGDSSML